MKLKPLALAIASFGACSFALAATDEPKTEKIEITGSRIKRVDAETSSPVEVISRAEIIKSGSATAAEVLRAITSNSGSFNENFTNSFSPGASGISLRGLGQKSTLVLINGRRAPNYGFAQNLSDTYFDLNSLPASAIERVEVLKDGASAVYGSDAIAGVINVIMRQDFVGLELTADQGYSNTGDLPETHFSATGGLGNVAEQGYNLLGSVDYFKRTGITQADREYTRDSDFRGQPGGAYNWSSSAGTYRPSTYVRKAFDTCPSSATKMPMSNFNSGGVEYSGDACAYNPAGFTNLFPDTERLNIFTKGILKIGSVEAFAEVFGSHTSTQQTFTPAAISNTGTGIRYNPETGGVSVIDTRLPVGNAANPYSTPARFGYTFFDVGPRSADITSDTFRVLGGLKGTVKTWDWEFALSGSQNKASQTQFNRVNAIALQKALADGSYNFLNPTAAQSDALRLNLERTATSKLYSADATIRGDLFELPAGAVGAVFGFDARRETLDDVPDPFLSGGYVLGQGATETHGSRNVFAGYFEFAAPITKNLELSLAGRGDKYSDFGSAFSPKVGVKYSPLKELALRGSWGKGFRAPTLAENAQSNSTYFVTVTDKNPPSDHPELKNKSFSVAGVLVGNPNLKAEKSTSINFGIIAQPVKALDMTVDYFRIKQKDLVQSDSTQYLIDHEATSGGAVVRDSVTGQILYVTTSYRNLSFVETSGIDLSLNWRLGQVGPAKASVKIDWSYLIDWKTPPAEGAEVENYAGNDGYNLYHRNTGKLQLNWDAPTWSASVAVNYLDGYNHKDPITDIDDNILQESVKSYITTDLYTSYNFSKALQASFSIQNLENKNPPYDAGYTAGYDTYDYNLRGRYFRLGLTYKF